MKNFKVLFACLGMSLFLVSCIENTGNSQTFPVGSAVVHYTSSYPGIPFLNTQYGIVVAASELADKSYVEGDCVLASFTIDYDNQPSNKYISITNVTDQKIKKENPIVMLDSESQDINETINSLSVDSITNLDIISDIIDNYLFMVFAQANSDINYSYQLVYSDSLINEVPVLYVCAEKSMTSSATLYGKYKYQAFDITPFVYKYTDAEKKTVSFYIQYKKGVDKEGNNVYKSLTSSPITLYNLNFSETQY